jgi:hypothetical protein
VQGGYINNVDDKVPKMYTLIWDAVDIDGVGESLLDVPVTEKIRCNITSFCAQHRDSVV